MRPLDLVPRNPEWVRQPLQTHDWPDFAAKIINGRLFQRIGSELVATDVDPRHLPAHLNTSFPSAPDPPETWEISDLWPRNVITDGWLAKQYETALMSQSPLALFPKQVLSKVNLYNQELLRGLVRNLRELDAKYSLNFAEESPFVAKVRETCGDMHPLGKTLAALKIRETQLQIVLLLALMPQFPAMEAVLDRHFDRLCIWQATNQENLVSDFLTAVVVPFFKTKVPQKVKEMLKINKGTLKSRSRPSSTAKPATPTPTERDLPDQSETQSMPLSGLAKALKMQNLATRTDTEVVMPLPRKRRITREFLADHIMSQPGFKQKSFVNHLEVTLRKPSRTPTRVAVKAPEKVETFHEAVEEVPEVTDIMSSTDSDE